MKTILFVCIENAGRSQMAQAMLNAYAEGRAVGLSAGTSPAGAVNPVVVEAMREIGIDLSGEKPKPLTRELADSADRIITMGCGAEGVCPVVFLPSEDWELEDPKGQPPDKVRAIRDLIKDRVLSLLESLG